MHPPLPKLDHQKEQDMTSEDIKQNKEHLHHNQKA
jgi:hypothetical protein